MDDLAGALNKIAEELAGIRRSLAALSMLCEDGYMRTSIETVRINEPTKKRRTIKK